VNPMRRVEGQTPNDGDDGHSYERKALSAEGGSSQNSQTQAPRTSLGALRLTLALY
jgi:hypothetical protein